MNFIILCISIFLTRTIFADAIPIQQKIQEVSSLFEKNLQKPSRTSLSQEHSEKLIIANLSVNPNQELSNLAPTFATVKRHSKREAADQRRFRETWSKLHARMRISSRRKKPRNPCGFLTRLDLIGYNPNFGCRGGRATQ